MVAITPDIPLASVKQSTHQHHLIFIYALFSKANTLISSIQSNIRTTRNGKLTNALPDPPIITDGKNLSID